MDPRRTLDEIRRIRAELTGKLRELDAEERLILEALRLMERRAGLTATGHKGTVGTAMEAVEPSRGAAIAVAKRKTKWPFPSALAARGLSLPEWARAQRKPALSTEVAKSWLKAPGRGGRPVPRFWAERIAAEFSTAGGAASLVPAVNDSWPNGIRD